MLSSVQSTGLTFTSGAEASAVARQSHLLMKIHTAMSKMPSPVVARAACDCVSAMMHVSGKNFVGGSVLIPPQTSQKMMNFSNFL